MIYPDAKREWDHLARLFTEGLQRFILTYTPAFVHVSSAVKFAAKRFVSPPSHRRFRPGAAAAPCAVAAPCAIAAMR